MAEVSRGLLCAFRPLCSRERFFADFILQRHYSIDMSSSFERPAAHPLPVSKILQVVRES